MKYLATIIICIFAFIIFFTAGVQAADEQQAIKDWNALQETSETLEKTMDGIVAQYAPNIISSDNEAVLAALSEYDNNLKQKIAAQLQEFSDKYGDVEAMDAKMDELIELDWRSGKHPTTQASRIYTVIKNYVDNIEQARLNKSDELVRDAENVQSQMGTFSRLVSEENFDKIKSLLETASRFNPENEKAKTWLKEVETQKKEALAAIEKKIDEAKWPGHYKNFAGPGNPDALSKTAMEWIQKDEEGGKDQTFAVCVRGDWVSAKKNLLGETVQWGLPIWAACYNSEEKAGGLCRVFSLTILTQEGGPGVKKEPPWTYTWVGDNYTMRLKNMPGGGAAGAATGASTGGRGFFGIIFWLALIGANLLAGFLAAATVLKAKVPQLEGVYSTLIPIRSLLGVIVLAVGLLTFLFDLFRLAPFANILPILSAIIAGILLGKEMIIAKAAGTKAEGAITSNIEKQKERLEKLEKQQVPIGFACLALAVLHLLIGGVIFF